MNICIDGGVYDVDVYGSIVGAKWRWVKGLCCRLGIEGAMGGEKQGAGHLNPWLTKVPARYDN